MKDEVKEALESLGLSEKERNVYVSLLELGDSPVNKISEKSGLVRVTVYPVLKSLIEKGFVSKYSMNRKSYFKPIQPDQIKDKVKEKEDKVNVALPSLKKISEDSEETTSVELFKGAKGISSFLEKLYSGEEKELWAYGNAKLIDEIVKYQSISARKMRINKNIKLNIVMSPLKRDYIKDPQYKKVTDIRFNKELEEMNIYIIFGREHVGILDLSKDPNAILIKNKEIAKYHKFVFDNLKKNSKKTA